MSKTALLIIDMFNTLEFPEWKSLVRQTLPVAKNIRNLKLRCKKKGIPVVYVNDNFGKWESSSENVYKICSGPGSRGAELAKILTPEEGDYFILKPRHSAFYCTNLEVFLKDLRIDNLILTGIAGNICVLFTAHDAHMRDYKLVVPRDCVASNTKRLNEYALQLLKKDFRISITPSKNLRL